MARHRRLSRFVLLVGAILGAGLLVPVGAAHAQANQRCFTETGYCISGRIREFWEQNGGLPVFGYPISPQREELVEGTPRQVQVFERNRLELHPENARPYDVLLGRVGAERLAQTGRSWFDFPKATQQPDQERLGCRFFAETGHSVCNEFLGAYRRYGLNLGQRGVGFEESLALFGLPLSEPMLETVEGTQYQVQWFERARFELHPENPATSRVLFGRLGAEMQNPNSIPASNMLVGPNWQLVSYGSLDTPTAAVANAGAGITFGADGRASGTSGCNRFGGGYSVSGDRLTFSPLASTRMACSEELNQQERSMFAALQGTVRFTMMQDMLQIFYDEGRSVLTFRAGMSQTGASVTGTVTYRARVALPAGAVVNVQLQDISRADAPATVIAEQIITTTGQQVPIPFELPYDPSQIDMRATYAVRATISIDGQLRFTSTTVYRVITNGNPSSVEVVVQQV